MVYFEKPGRDNTEETLQIAKDEATKRGIGYMVVASTIGDSGLLAAQMLRGTDIRLVVVTHSTGHREAGEQLFSDDTKKEIEGLGGWSSPEVTPSPAGRKPWEPRSGFLPRP